jgi:sarcosine oxidase gamma subunit
MRTEISRLSRLTRLLAVPAVLAAALSAAGCELAFTDLKAESRNEWSKSYTLTGAAEVEVRNLNGAIEVEPSSDGQLHVRATRTAKAADEAAAKALLDKVEIVEDVSGSRVRLESKGPTTSGILGGNYKVDYALRVPAGMRVAVKTTNGHVSLANLGNTIEARTTNGGISGKGLTGPVEAGTTNGGIEIALDEVAAGGISLETTNGGVDLSLPSAARADISARVVNGGISTGSLALERLDDRESRRKLEARINGGGPRIRLETTNGGISLAGR